MKRGQAATEPNTQNLTAVLLRMESERRDDEYKKWRTSFSSLREDQEKKLRNGFIVGMELQPSRWIYLGLDLIGSRKAAGTVQHSNGVEGPDLQSYLPYPVYQMGAEIFLKGMWLYGQSECRDLTDDDYIPKHTRDELLKRIKSVSRNHDLKEIVQKVRSVKQYAKDSIVSEFLTAVLGITNLYYLPVSRDWSWADERYPKRFYNDLTQQGKADSYRSYPPHKFVCRLFTDAAKRLEQIWGN